MNKWLKILGGALLLLLVALVVIQLVPYGRNHDNPPVVQEPAWDSPETRALAATACYDCHSNETNWDRWYANIAPASWLVEHDVEEGRQILNFSEWGSNPHAERAGELAEVVREGEMPPAQYLLMHPEAKLPAAQQQKLVDGLVTTARQ